MNGQLAVAMAAFGFIIGGLVNVVDDVLSFIAVVTAACTAVARYTAVVLNRDQAQIERVTAKGFFVGLFVSFLLLGFDHL